MAALSAMSESENGSTATAAELWDTISAEVDKLVSKRQRGVHFSEDFAVDRVCNSLEKLRKKYTANHNGANSAQQLVGLKVELAMEEQRHKLQQARIEEALLQTRLAIVKRAELEKELAVEQAARVEFNEKGAKMWREASGKTQERLAALRAKELEAQELEAELNAAGATAQSSSLLSEIEAAEAEAESKEQQRKDIASERELVEKQINEATSRTSFASPGYPAKAFLSPRSGDAKSESSETLPQVRDELLRIANRSSENVRNLQNAMAGFGRGASNEAGSVTGGFEQHASSTVPSASSTFSESSGYCGGSVPSAAANFSSSSGSGPQSQWLDALRGARLSDPSLNRFADGNPDPLASGSRRGRSSYVDDHRRAQTSDILDGSLRSNVFGLQHNSPFANDLLSRSMRVPEQQQLNFDSSSSVLDEAQKVLQKMERLSSMRAASATGVPMKY